MGTSFCKFLQCLLHLFFCFMFFVFVFFGLFLNFFLLIYFISALCENRTLTFWHFARKPTQTFLALRDFFGILQEPFAISEFARTRTLQRNEDMGLRLFFFISLLTLFVFSFFFFYLFF